MGTSLAFHFIFSALGIGLPLILLIVEGMWLRTGDTAYRDLTRKWSKALGALFAIGAVSGTALSFELGLLWPEFMRHAGAIIGTPFSAEGFAFFVEAIFVGLYLYGWERLTPLQHWLCGIPIALSGLLSGIFVVSANAWMNTPAGFRVSDGHAVDIRPLQAMLNPAFATEAVHTSLAAYIFVGAAIAATAAWRMLRSLPTARTAAALRIGMAVVAVVMPLQIIAGDVSARFDATHEPVKFAALEGQFVTQSWAPLRIGGYPDEAAHRTVGALEVPGMLSYLAYGDPRATVRGLTSFPAADVPNSLPVHLSFQAMVGSGSLLLLIAAWWAWTTRLGRRVPKGLLLRAIAIAGPLAFIAMEAGWMVTEEGRQPWIVTGFMRTRDAVTPAAHLDLAFYSFTFVYLVLAGTLAWALVRIEKNDPPAGAH